MTRVNGAFSVTFNKSARHCLTVALKYDGKLSQRVCCAVNRSFSRVKSAVNMKLSYSAYVSSGCDTQLDSTSINNSAITCGFLVCALMSIASRSNGAN